MAFFLYAALHYFLLTPCILPLRELLALFFVERNPQKHYTVNID